MGGTVRNYLGICIYTAWTVEYAAVRSMRSRVESQVVRYGSIELDSSHPAVAVRSNLLSFPASQASPGKHPQDRARSRFHTSDSTPPPTAHLPTTMLAASEGRNCGSGGTTSDGGRVVHRQEGDHRYCPGPAAIYVLRPDDHHVFLPFDVESSYWAGNGCARGVEVSEDVVSVLRAVRYPRSREGPWRSTLGDELEGVCLKLLRTQHTPRRPTSNMV